MTHFPPIFSKVFSRNQISVCNVLSWNFGMMVGLTLESLLGFARRTCRWLMLLGPIQSFCLTGHSPSCFFLWHFRFHFCKIAQNCVSFSLYSSACWAFSPRNYIPVFIWQKQEVRLYMTNFLLLKYCIARQNEVELREKGQWAH